MEWEEEKEPVTMQADKIQEAYWNLKNKAKELDKGHPRARETLTPLNNKLEEEKGAYDEKRIELGDEANLFPSAEEIIEQLHGTVLGGPVEFAGGEPWIPDSGSTGGGRRKSK